MCFVALLLELMLFTLENRNLIGCVFDKCLVLCLITVKIDVELLVYGKLFEKFTYQILPSWLDSAE